MAKAFYVPPPTEPEIQLTLTKAEAETLRAVCNRVGGDPSTSRRRHVDAISTALSNIGGLECNTDDIDLLRRSLYFIERIS